VVGGGKKAGPVASQVKVKKNIVDIKVNQVKRGYCFVIVDGRQCRAGGACGGARMGERGVAGQAGRGGAWRAADGTARGGAELTFVADLLRVLLLEDLLQVLRDIVVLGAVRVVRHAVAPDEVHVVLELLRRGVRAGLELLLHEEEVHRRLDDLGLRGRAGRGGGQGERGGEACERGQLGGRSAGRSSPARSLGRTGRPEGARNVLSLVTLTPILT
jgi:hypothetical protein